MTITAVQFAQRLDRLADELGKATMLGVNQAARQVHAIVNAQIAADIGGESRMSGLGGKKFAGDGGAEVRATLRPSTSTKNSTAYVGPWGKGMAGAFGILEGGTVAHITGGKTSSRIARQGKKKDGTRTYNRIRNPKAAGRKLMATPWGPRWGPFMVSGSPAKRTLSRAARQAERVAVLPVRAHTRKAIVKAFS